MRWAQYYCVLDRYTQSLAINVGPRWSTDEKYLKINGKGHWLFSVLDSGTRFLLSWDVSPSKPNYDACKLFDAAVDRAGNVVPAILASDKLAVFSKAFKKIFYRRKSPQPIHFAESHIKNERSNNNAHERFNGTIKDHLGNIRRFGKIESAHVMSYVVYYNFVRPHMGLDGATPANAAGIIVEGAVIWRTLIENAALACILSTNNVQCAHQYAKFRIDMRWLYCRYDKIRLFGMMCDQEL